MTALAIILLPFILLWRGYVLAILWGWFLTPLGVPSLSVAAAVGVILILMMAITQHTREKEITPVRMALAFAHPALMLLFGWIVQGWFM